MSHTPHPEPKTYSRNVDCKAPRSMKRTLGVMDDSLQAASEQRLQKIGADRRKKPRRKTCAQTLSTPTTNPTPQNTFSVNIRLMNSTSGTPKCFTISPTRWLTTIDTSNPGWVEDLADSAWLQFTPEFSLAFLRMSEVKKLRNILQFPKLRNSQWAFLSLDSCRGTAAQFEVHLLTHAMEDQHPRPFGIDLLFNLGLYAATLPPPSPIQPRPRGRPRKNASAPLGFPSKDQEKVLRPSRWVGKVSYTESSTSINESEIEKENDSTTSESDAVDELSQPQTEPQSLMRLTADHNESIVEADQSCRGKSCVFLSC